MKGVRLFLFLGIVILAVGYLVFSTPSRPTNRNIQVARLADDLVIGDPIEFRNLAIFPVTSKVPRNDDRFITLDEGLKAGTIEILERGAIPAIGSPGPPPTTEESDPFALPPNASAPAADPFAAPPAAENEPTADRPLTVADPFADPPLDQQTSPRAQGEPIHSNSVNALMVVNHSDKPLYLMPGEIVIGGSQDRTIGQELVVAPDHKPVPISVFCVERGRWGGRDQQAYAGLLEATHSHGVITSSSANLSLVVSETTELANAGKFVGSVGSLNKAARIAVQSGEGQAKVWDEVAIENDKNRVQSSSGTFASNYSDVESVGRLSPYLQQLLKPIEETENIVGVIVAVNGEVESMDVFESTPLFRKLWPKLLKSFALDASHAEPGPEVGGKTAARSDALAFLNDVAQAREDRIDSSGELAVSQGSNDRVLLFSAHERRIAVIGDAPSLGGYGGAGMGGMGGGAFSGAIHSSGFAK